jgi:uncharacterized protein (TIGR03066 family)
MMGLRLLLVAVAVAVFGGAATADDKKPDKASDNAKLIVGTWEVTKGDDRNEVAIGDGFEFSKDGRFKATHTGSDGKVESHEATYEIDGDQLTATYKGSGSKSITKTYTIKKLTDTELVLAYKDKSVELKRKKGS